MTRTTVIAGVGEVLGTALARRFAEAGDDVALLARTPDVVEDLATEIDQNGGSALAVTVDVTDRAAVTDAFEEVRSAFGEVDVLVHNASAPAAGGIEADPTEFERPWRVRTYGGFLCVREAAPDLEPGGRVLFSGTSLSTDPSGRTVGWDSAAAATRGLARSLGEGLDGVGVAYVSIGGSVAPPGGYVTDDRIAAETVADRFLSTASDDWRGFRDVRVDP